MCLYIYVCLYIYIYIYIHTYININTYVVYVHIDRLTLGYVWPSTYFRWTLLCFRLKSHTQSNSDHVIKPFFFFWARNFHVCSTYVNQTLQFYIFRGFNFILKNAVYLFFLFFCGCWQCYLIFIYLHLDCIKDTCNASYKTSLSKTKEFILSPQGQKQLKKKHFKFTFKKKLLQVFDGFQKSEQTFVKLLLQWAIIKTFIIHVPTGFHNK